MIRPRPTGAHFPVRSALVADILDAFGHRYQCLPSSLIASEPGNVLCGRAFPVRAVEIDYIPERPYTQLLKALDSIGSGEVFVLGTGGRTSAAGWGELLSTACIARGAVGAVVDAPMRDAALVAALNFPVFSRGRHPTDCNGRLEVLEYGSPVTIGAVTISSGDFVVGDVDGVVVIPAALSDAVMLAAADKGSQENLFRAAVANGMQPSLAYERFGVL